MQGAERESEGRRWKPDINRKGEEGLQKGGGERERARGEMSCQQNGRVKRKEKKKLVFH